MSKHHKKAENTDIVNENNLEENMEYNEGTTQEIQQSPMYSKVESLLVEKVKFNLDNPSRKRGKWGQRDFDAFLDNALYMENITEDEKETLKSKAYQALGYKNENEKLYKIRLTVNSEKKIEIVLRRDLSFVENQINPIIEGLRQIHSNYGIKEE